MPTINLNQQDFYYALHQNPQAIHNIILIHGAGGSHLVWPAALRRMPDANVYVLDLPGHGRSSGEGHAQIESYANLVIQFIKTLTLDRVVLIGHSMGGAISQMIALQNLSEILALVLVGTGAKLRISPAILDLILPDYKQAIITMNQFTWATSTPPDLVAKGHDMLAETKPRVMYNDLIACDQFDIRSQLAQIDKPTLVISSSDDKLTPPKYGRFLADHIPQAQFALLEGAGHMMMLEKPGETAEAVKEFLKSEE